MERKFNVGDYVKVVNEGSIYSTYEDFMLEHKDEIKPEHLLKWRYNNYPKGEFTVGTVVFSALHELESEGYVYLVSVNDGECFLYNEVGLKLVNPGPALTEVKGITIDDVVSFINNYSGIDCDERITAALEQKGFIKLPVIDEDWVREHSDVLDNMVNKDDIDADFIQNGDYNDVIDELLTDVVDREWLERNTEILDEYIHKDDVTEDYVKECTNILYDYVPATIDDCAEYIYNYASESETLSAIATLVRKY